MGIELKEQGIDTSKFKYTLEETLYVEEKIKESAEKQRKLGLGNPKASVDHLSGGAKSGKAIKMLLQKGFTFIEEPDIETFPRFVGSGAESTTSVRPSQKPKLAMVKLTENTEKITVVLSNGERHSADIPAIPSPAIALAERVKAVLDECGLNGNGSGEMHLIYEPMWVQQPQLDPVLVCKISKGYWIKIAEWGSDVDLINQTLQERNMGDFS